MGRGGTCEEGVIPARIWLVADSLLEGWGGCVVILHSACRPGVLSDSWSDREPQGGRPLWVFASAWACAYLLANLFIFTLVCDLK